MRWMVVLAVVGCGAPAPGGDDAGTVADAGPAEDCLDPRLSQPLLGIPWVRVCDWPETISISDRNCGIGSVTFPTQAAATKVGTAIRDEAGRVVGYEHGLFDAVVIRDTPGFPKYTIEGVSFAYLTRGTDGLFVELGRGQQLWTLSAIGRGWREERQGTVRTCSVDTEGSASVCEWVYDSLPDLTHRLRRNTTPMTACLDGRDPEPDICEIEHIDRDAKGRIVKWLVEDRRGPDFESLDTPRTEGYVVVCRVDWTYRD